MLACPKCCSYMFAGMNRGVQVDCCSNCQGIWLDQGELARLAKTIDDLPERQSTVATKTDFSCPHCGKPLSTEAYASGNDLMIDTCTSCNGVFLDKGELERVQQLAKQIDDIFPPSQRSSMTSKAERKEALSSIYKTESPAAKSPLIDRTTFIAKVYGLLVVALLITLAGSWYGMTSGLGLKYFIPATIAEVVIFLIALWTRRKPVVNMVTLLTYTFLSGFTLSALLERYVASGKGAIVTEAASLTAIIFLVLSAYVHMTKKDFSWMGGILITGLIGLIVVGIGFFFFPSEFGMFLWSSVSAVLFSGYILYDTSNIILKFKTDEVVSAVLELYLDIINLFIDLLRILSYLQRK